MRWQLWFVPGTNFTCPVAWQDQPNAAGLPLACTNHACLLVAICRTEFDLPDAAFGFFHDFLVTPSHYIFLESPSEEELQLLCCFWFLLLGVAGLCVGCRPDSSITFKMEVHG